VSTRVKWPQVSPDGYKALQAFGQFAHQSALEKSLLELVRLRVSQINNCAYCVDMHWKDLRALGETEQRLSLLSVWREYPGFNSRERAALAWGEALTRISTGDVTDADFEAAKTIFSEKELVDLSLTVASINAWNRMGVAFRPEPGRYQPPNHSAQ
jgi:AhpD family alkylhydroperoxidase